MSFPAPPRTSIHWFSSRVMRKTSFEGVPYDAEAAVQVQLIVTRQRDGDIHDGIRTVPSLVDRGAVRGTIDRDRDSAAQIGIMVVEVLTGPRTRTLGVNDPVVTSRACDSATAVRPPVTIAGVEHVVARPAVEAVAMGTVAAPEGCRRPRRRRDGPRRRHPRMVSFPGPPRSRSSPAEPRRESPPGPPCTSYTVPMRVSTPP